MNWIKLVFAFGLVTYSLCSCDVKKESSGCLITIEDSLKQLGEVTIFHDTCTNDWRVIDTLDRLLRVGKLENRLFTGSGFQYYSNGNISHNVPYYKNKKEIGGMCYEYYESDSGQVHHKALIGLNHGNRVIHSYTDYDTKGNVINEGSKVRVSMESDTVRLGDEFEIVFTLENQKFPNLELSFFKTDVMVIDSTSVLDLVNDVKSSTSIIGELKANNKGRAILRGLVENYEFDQDSVKQGYVYFFYKEYFVIE